MAGTIHSPRYRLSISMAWMTFPFSSCSNASTLGSDQAMKVIRDDICIRVFPESVSGDHLLRSVPPVFTYLVIPAPGVRIAASRSWCIHSRAYLRLTNPTKLYELAAHSVHSITNVPVFHASGFRRIRLRDRKHPTERQKEEFSPGCGDLSLQGNDGRNQRRPGPAVRYLRSWNRGSAWPDREKAWNGSQA